MRFATDDRLAPHPHRRLDKVENVEEPEKSPGLIRPEMAEKDCPSIHSDWPDARLVEVVRARAAKLNQAIRAAEYQGLRVHVQLGKVADGNSDHFPAITHVAAKKEF